MYNGQLCVPFGFRLSLQSYVAFLEGCWHRTTTGGAACSKRHYGTFAWVKLQHTDVCETPVHVQWAIVCTFWIPFIAAIISQCFGGCLVPQYLRRCSLQQEAFRDIGAGASPAHRHLYSIMYSKNRWRVYLLNYLHRCNHM